MDHDTKMCRYHTSNLTAHLKVLEKNEEIIPKRSRWQGMVKLMAEINIIETNKQKSMKHRVGSLTKVLKLRNQCPN